MIFSFKIIVFIFLVKYTGFALCGFTYDDDYSDVNRDNYRFDLSEQRHVSAEQPKYNTMVKPYRGPARPKAEDFAIPGDTCDVTKYNTHLKPLYILQTNTTQDSTDEIDTLLKDFQTKLKAQQFNGKEVCYHEVSKLYCSNQGKCECLEVVETGYVNALIPAQEESYDRYTLKHYKHCRIRYKFGCKPSHAKDFLHQKCEEGLFCSKIGVCMKSSSEQNRNFGAFTAMLIVTYKFLCL